MLLEVALVNDFIGIFSDDKVETFMMSKQVIRILGKVLFLTRHEDGLLQSINSAYAPAVTQQSFDHSLQ